VAMLPRDGSYRLCSFENPADTPRVGIWTRDGVIDLGRTSLGSRLPLDQPQPLVACCMVGPPMREAIAGLLANYPEEAFFEHQEIRLLPPVPRPNKLLLLAGNYPEHVKEQGDVAAERRETFPYVFMKPPTTTLVADGASVAIPRISPNKIDYELELAVVIGKVARRIEASDALGCVAGYTIINDLSDRGYRPTPDRRQRPRDAFFDWLHGKWHDGFCPCGPCVLPAAFVGASPFAMQLTVNGSVRQRASSAEMIFSVAEVIAFISRSVTLEPGDIISTGTPSGVGNATGQFLRSGDHVEATIESIGSLRTQMIDDGDRPS
jgi:2,4-didehydro-3-deoxy-L-rhamnonate hydrolase